MTRHELARLREIYFAISEGNCASRRYRDAWADFANLIADAKAEHEAEDRNAEHLQLGEQPWH